MILAEQRQTIRKTSFNGALDAMTEEAVLNENEKRFLAYVRTIKDGLFWAGPIASVATKFTVVKFRLLVKTLLAANEATPFSLCQAIGPVGVNILLSLKN